MATKRVCMRRVRELLELRYGAGLPKREICRRTGVAWTTVRKVLELWDRSGLIWPEAAALTDSVLEEALYGSRVGSKAGWRSRPEPDWAEVNRALKCKHVTLQVLWEEYIAVHPDGYRYSRFCDLYRAFESRLPLVMRQAHLGGEKLFVDFAGDPVPVIVDRLTGEMRGARIFVAVMGASSLTFACSSWGERLADWIEGQARALSFFGGAPQLIVPDNPKAAVIKASLYEPAVNRTYAEFARHYGMAILPARPRRPRDKAKVEAAVGIVERWLLGRLRRRRFFGLAEVDQAIAELLALLNERRMLRQHGRTRRQLFEELDRPNLRPLPLQPYVFAEWKLRKVGLDYHVEIDGHYYSVPHAFAREKVEARSTARTVEIFHKGERIAAHVREAGRGRHTTQMGHMPDAHRAYAGWTIEAVMKRATEIGPSTAMLAKLIIEAKRHPLLGLRATLGVVRLARLYGRERLERASARSLEIGARSYGQVRSILDAGLDRAPAAEPRNVTPIVHPNLRGPRYYH